MMERLILLVQLLFIPYIVFFPKTISAVQVPCCICGQNCFPVNDRANTVVDSTGMTCTDYAVKVASTYEAGSTECSQMSFANYDRCCTTGPFALGDDTSTHDCSSVTPSNVGPYCDLCANGRYPLRPSTTTTLSGVVGSPTCADLYCMAKNGYILGELCKPMQTFMDTPCGCYNDFTINPDINVTYNQNPQLVVSDPVITTQTQKKIMNMRKMNKRQWNGGTAGAVRSPTRRWRRRMNMMMMKNTRK